MIKFKALIQKKTGNVINYDYWLEMLRRGYGIDIHDSITGKTIYEPKEMLFSDDFKIIYDSEFTTEELELANVSVFECVRRDIIFLNAGNKLINKIEGMNEEREFNRFNYGIEV